MTVLTPPLSLIETGSSTSVTSGLAVTAAAVTAVAALEPASASL